MREEYGQYEQVNGGVVNDRNSEIAELKLQLAKEKYNAEAMKAHMEDIYNGKNHVIADGIREMLVGMQQFGYKVAVEIGDIERYADNLEEGK